MTSNPRQLPSQRPRSLCEQGQLGALKLLLPSLRDKPEISARVAEEARTATCERMLSEAMAIDREARLPSVKALAARLMPFGTDAGRASHTFRRRRGSR